MYNLFVILGAIIVGISIGFQSPMNAGLGRLTDPRIAALLNFAVGGTLILLLSIFTGVIKDIPMLKAVPWYYLLGGVLGFIIVNGSILVIPILGAGMAISLIVTAQLITGIVIDHFGWFGVRQVPLDWQRLAGILLMVLGVRMITR